MSVIDIHTHAFPDDLAKRAIKKLEGTGPWKAQGSGTVKGLIASMDRSDIDVSVLCTIATKPDQAQGIMDWCMAIRSDRIEPFPSVHPNAADAPEWMARFHDESFAGIKLHPMYQDFAADDPIMDPIYQAAVDLGMAVEIHCGFDISFAPDDDRASPRRIRNVIDRFSDLKLVATHLGGWRAWDASRELLVGTPVYLETSFSLTEMSPQAAADIIRAHGVERVMFGTDWPWETQHQALAELRTIGLNQAELRQVSWSTAAKLLQY